MNKVTELLNTFVGIFEKLEKWLAIVLASIIMLIVLSALYRVIISTGGLIKSNIISPTSIDFKLYTDIFAKILTLLISIEFMHAIISIIKKREIKVLLIDVILITGLALCRKLIIVEYKDYEPLYIFAFGFVLISLGVLYFFINRRVE